MNLTKLLICLLLFTLICFKALPQSDCGVVYKPARFSSSAAELDSFIKDNFIIPLAAQAYGIKASIKTTFIVDSMGQLMDVFISQVELNYFMLYEEEEGTFDALRKAFLNEAERVILFSEGLWTPANCDGKIISDSIKKDFEIIPENYSKREKDSRTPYSLGSNAMGGVFEKVTHETPEKYYNNGVKKLTQKKYDIASKYFREAIQYKNDYIDAYYNLGIVELKLNNLKAACASWNMSDG